MQLPTITPEQQKTFIAKLRDEETKLLSFRMARNTVMGYAYDWAMFETWCRALGLQALPAADETVRLYLCDLLQQGKKLTTAKRRKSAIAHHHKVLGYTSPITKQTIELLRSAQRLLQQEPRQMRPLSIEQIELISEELKGQGSKRAMRDRALIVFGFASALRRSSLAALKLSDVEFVELGLMVHVRKEKQDQEARGRDIGIPRGKNASTCAVRCLAAWLRLRGKREGPLFPRLDRRKGGGHMDGECVCRILKRAVTLIGLDPDDRYAGHSLRAGFITAAGEAGIGTMMIAAHTGHRSLQTLHRYFRRQGVWNNNVAGMLDL